MTGQTLIKKYILKYESGTTNDTVTDIYPIFNNAEPPICNPKFHHE